MVEAEERGDVYLDSRRAMVTVVSVVVPERVAQLRLGRVGGNSGGRGEEEEGGFGAGSTRSTTMS